MLGVRGHSLSHLVFALLFFCEPSRNLQSFTLRPRNVLRSHLNFLLLIHSCSESSKPLCDGCHQWIAQRRGRYLSWELGRELPASLPPSTWYWYQWRKNTITTAKTKTNKHKNKKQRYWQRQRHSDLAPRAIDQTSVDCQLPVEQMFHLILKSFSKFICTNVEVRELEQEIMRFLYLMSNLIKVSSST